ALKQWTAAGGNLVVYDMGDDYGELLRLEAALGLAGISAREAPLTRWKGPDESDRTFEQLQRVVDQEWALTSSRLADHPDTNLRKSADELSTLQAERRTATLGDPEWLPMRTLEYGHGKVIAMPDENPFPGSDAKWQWLEQVIKPNDDWNARVGVDLQTGDLQFLNYLIPDVGLPPVSSFRLLITLFVIVIGPVNYLLLKRRKRLFLLLVTVPLGAAIVTGGLFSYALIKD